MVLTCTIFLDPRYKLDFVDYIFKKIELVEHIAKMKVERIQTQLYKFFFFLENMNAPRLWPLQTFHLVLEVLAMVIEMIMMKIWKKVDVNCILFGICCGVFSNDENEMLWHFFNCNFF